MFTKDAFGGYMLINFEVTNFRSLRDTATLSAVAQKPRHPVATRKRNLIVPDEEIGATHEVADRNLFLLPVLGVFGANASGKSNIILALNALRFLMLYGIVPDRNLIDYVTPFLLDEENKAAPTDFCLRLAFEGIIYIYSLCVDRQRVLEERLDYLPASPAGERLLFSRRYNSQTRKDEWKNGPDFKGPHTQLEPQVKPEQPFLALLNANLHLEIIRPLYHWLLYSPLGVSEGYTPHEYEWAAEHCFEDEAALRAVSDFVCRFDTGVARIEVDNQRRSNKGGEAYQVWAVHQTTHGEYRLPMEVQSAGTLDLFVLAYKLKEALNQGGLLLSDEFGANLHPNVMDAIVRAFQSRETNPFGAQLVFVSHDNTLMQKNLLRRDQIWFTQKDPNGATELYPLSAYNARNDLAVDKAYLDGRFGAVPVLPSSSDWLRPKTGAAR